MEKAKLKKAFELVLGGLLGFLISTISYHYIVGQSWEFLLGGIAIPEAIAIGLCMLAVRYIHSHWAIIGANMSINRNAQGRFQEGPRKATPHSGTTRLLEIGA